MWRASSAVVWKRAVAKVDEFVAAFDAPGASGPRPESFLAEPLEVGEVM